jgi:hypothetical protein
LAIKLTQQLPNIVANGTHIKTPVIKGRK